MSRVISNKVNSSKPQAANEGGSFMKTLFSFFVILFFVLPIDIWGQSAVNNWTLNNNGAATDLNNTGSRMSTQNDGQIFYLRGFTTNVYTIGQEWVVSTMWLKDFHAKTPNVLELQYKINKTIGTNAALWVALVLQDSQNNWGFTWGKASGVNNVFHVNVDSAYPLFKRFIKGVYMVRGEH